MNIRTSNIQINPHPRFKTISACLALLCVLLVTSNVYARKSDVSQPLNITADRIEYDENSGIQLWEGNVEMTQGTMRIRADRIKVTLLDKKLSRIEGSGSPIEFQQENEAGELVTGQSNSIDYDALSSNLALTGSATLTQPGQRLQSDRIVFDLVKQKVSAEGGKKGRVSIQIQPPSTDKP